MESIVVWVELFGSAMRGHQKSAASQTLFSVDEDAWFAVFCWMVVIPIHLVPRDLTTDQTS
jgi:hypothetical protein